VGDNCETDEKVAEAAKSEAEATAAAEQSKQTTTLIGGIAGGVIVLILLIIAAVKYQQHRIAMRPVDFDTQFALMVSMGLIEPEHVKVKMKPREIRRKDLTLVKVIGSGAFGEVYKAQLDEMFTRSTPEYTVAAKTVLDAKSSPEATREMLAEAGVMAAVGAHPNLVSLIGIITRGDPLVLILQFCAQGELLGMLKKAAAEGKPIALMDKMQMAREVAQGMTHLSKEHFIHRDLACRNVLYADGMCKIADFGLSRGGGGESTAAEDEDAATHEDYYKSTAGVFPVRWTAPEAMETLRFTTASDVWSFGIVVIEMLVDGETPYHGMSNPDVMKLTMTGGRHGKPPLCSNKLYRERQDNNPESPPKHLASPSTLWALFAIDPTALQLPRVVLRLAKAGTSRSSRCCGGWSNHLKVIPNDSPIPLCYPNPHSPFVGHIEHIHCVEILATCSISTQFMIAPVRCSGHPRGMLLVTRMPGLQPQATA
jgi:serine/threonine protein kinase